MSGASDTWVLRDSNKVYSSKRVYHALAPSDPAPRPMMWIWKSCVLPKIKIFFWLLLQDRLNTRDLLARKNCSIPSQLCEDANVEDFIHLFFACDFSQRFWWNLSIEWNMNSLSWIFFLMGRGGTIFHVLKKSSWLGAGLFGIRGTEPYLMVMNLICKSLSFFSKMYLFLLDKSKTQPERGHVSVVRHLVNSI
jgi:hypothetical protein